MQYQKRLKEKGFCEDVGSNLVVLACLAETKRTVQNSSVEPVCKQRPHASAVVIVLTSDSCTDYEGLGCLVSLAVGRFKC